MGTRVHSNEHVRVEVSEMSQVAQARHVATMLAHTCGFDEHAAGTVALLATELSTNQVKHAKDGEILLRMVARVHGEGVEILALDRGPGMANVDHAFVDGHSTSGTSGTGLGAISRMASEFDVYSQPGKGTALLARLWKSSEEERREPKLMTSAMTAGLVCLAKAGEEVCGDGWVHDEHADRALYAVVDGLGHGLQAAEASRTAILSLRDDQTIGPAGYIDRAHGMLRSTRGAAMAVAELVHCQAVVKFAGVGNIGAVLVGPQGSRHLVSLNGTVGHQIHRVKEFAYPWPAGTMLIMHSDGIATHWDLHDYPGLTSHHPALVAGILYRDFARGRDDVTVLVVKGMSDRRRN